ncbi:Bud site selection protein 6, fungi [Phaffia rhodozyma]|uniref:Bud site selection protein 6, fungi n=1 Tax=Phaffia rhodozyma TaxID=264483 RepID=A0A0F7SPI0_PHARH|nr:Bud site selection protein 6, fungi [Phaffia rhodozyma]
MSAPSRESHSRRHGSTSSMASSSGGRRPSEKTHMESAVTKLLVSTRQLLSALTDWSLGKITEVDVSDFYVRLGNDFNTAVSAFSDLEINMSDLLEVPNRLRNCLERCINQDPSPQNLEHYLPEIRQTIVSLLQGLKAKQALYKSRKDDEKRARIVAAERERTEYLRQQEQEARQPISRVDPAVRETGQDPDERALFTEDNRWVPPISQTNQRYQAALPRPQLSGSSRSLPLPEASQRPPSISSRPTQNPSLPRSSFDIAPSQFHSQHQQHHVPSSSTLNYVPHESTSSTSRPISPTSASESVSIHSQSSRRPHISSRHRDGPLPAPPPDAFKPTRSRSGASPSDERNFSGPTEEMIGPPLRVSTTSLPPTHAGAGEPPSRNNRSSHRTSNSAVNSSTMDPSRSRYQQPPLVSETDISNTDTTSSFSRPALRHSLSDPPVSPNFATSFTESVLVELPVPPTITAQSDSTLDLPSSFSNDSTDKLSPLPILAPVVIEPLAGPSPSSPPNAVSIADQTLSNLRGSGNGISRRASQRYSSYQINKIMDAGGLGAISNGDNIGGNEGTSGGGPGRSKSSRRLSGIPDESSLEGKSSKLSPARSPRSVRIGPPPVPALPEGIGATPRRPLNTERLFVPPAEDTGVEVRIEADPDSDSPVATINGGSVVRSPSAFLSAQRSKPPSLMSLSEEDQSKEQESLHVASSDRPIGEVVKPAGGRARELATEAVNQVEEETEQDSAASDSTRSITVFLVYNRECKKCVVEATPTIPALRLLFMEKFSYTAETEEFPAIYIQDPKTEWRYEWEEGDKLGDGAMLSLNIEPLDQVKQHIDSQISGLSRKLEDLIRESVGPLSSQFATLQASNLQSHRLSAGLSLATATQARSSSSTRSPSQNIKSGHEGSLPKVIRTAILSDSASPSATIKDQSGSVINAVNMTSSQASTSPTIDLISTLVQPSIATSLTALTVPADIHQTLRAQLDEIQALRRDLGVARQVHTDGMAVMKEIFTRVRKENQRLREVAASSLNTGRAFVNASKSKIDIQSQETLRRMEDLQDVVEELYQDVTERMVVPKPMVMRSLKKDLEQAEGQLKELLSTTKAATTTWRATWADEMENVMTEEKHLKYHLALTNDIEADYNECKRVFDQITLYAAQRGVGGSHGGSIGRSGGSNSYRQLGLPTEDPQSSLSTVMFQIQGATVDPEKRLRAIENAARMRQREMDGQKEGNELTSQLSEFVDGRKLRKTGGVEETERLRQKKNELALKGVIGGGVGVLKSVPSLTTVKSAETTPASSSSPIPTVTVEPSESIGSLS